MVTAKRKTYGEWRVAFGSGLILALWVIGCFTAIAMAQPDTAATGAAEAPQTYEQLPVDEALKRNATTINQILMSGQFNTGQQAIFTDYFEKYALARWTTPDDPRSLGNLPSYRKDLRNSLARHGSGAGPQVHDYLAKLVLDFMNKIVAGHYHPAVQVNAMLMIGELNSVEGNPPTPLPAALDVLLADAGNAKLAPAVRIAAMVGVQRHIMLRTGDNDARRTILAAVLKLATDEASPTDVGRQWLLAQSVETLAQLGTLGENNAAFKLIVKTLSDKKLSLATRSVAANSLGRLNYEGATNIKPADAAAAVGQFLIDACTDELKRAKSADKGTTQRRMKQRLAAAATALGGENEDGKGLASAARDPAQRTFITKLQEEITAGIKEFDDPDRAPEELHGAVDDLRSKLEAWAKTKP